MLGLAAHRFFDNAIRSSAAAASARERCAARVRSEPVGERDDRVGGIGWFDSSLALQEGLTVVEHHSLHGDTLELAVALLVH